MSAASLVLAPQAMRVNSEAGGNCPICLEVCDEASRVHTVCMHAFHSNCLSRWLIVKDECPVCRRENPLSLQQSHVIIHMPQQGRAAIPRSFYRRCHCEELAVKVSICGCMTLLCFGIVGLVVGGTYGTPEATVVKYVALGSFLFSVLSCMGACCKSFCSIGRPRDREVGF